MKALFLFILLVGMVSCGDSTVKSNDQKVSLIDSILGANDPSVLKSIDYRGIYKGIIPCADCEGIEVTLILNDSTYLRTSKYLGFDKVENKYEEQGMYFWKNNNVIVLDNIKDVPNQYLIGEDWVLQLDMDGNTIEGELADAYIFKKEI